MTMRTPRPLLFPGWIVYGLFVLNPIFWVLGFGGFVWALAAFPLIVWILLHPEARRPPGTTLFVLYVLWAAGTVVMLDSVTRLLVFGFRYLEYIAAIALAVYVYSERRVGRELFVKWVATLWVWAIIGGYAGLVFPSVRINVTAASTLLPRAIAANDYVGNLVRPRLAQIQEVAGLQLPRPATLWAFTNEWGGNVGLLTPFFVAAFVYSDDWRRRRLGIIGLVVAAPVMILSVNRGLWLSVALIFTAVAIRGALVGRTAALKILVGGAVIVSVLMIATPIGDVVSGRLSDSSADARAGIYREAWEGALESPVLGMGGPRPSENPFSPAIGTHGHLWFAMFSHGFVGLGLYVAWLVSAMYQASRFKDPVSLMLAAVVYVGALQMFFYNMFTGSFAIILVAVGLLGRRSAESQQSGNHRSSSTKSALSAGGCSADDGVLSGRSWRGTPTR